MKKQILKLLKQRAIQAFCIYKPYSIDLEPIQEIPEREKWLFEPENKALLEKLKRGIKDGKTTDLGSFCKYLEKNE